MSKNKLEEIEARSKKNGTVTGSKEEEPTTETDKIALDKIEAESKNSGTITGKSMYTRKIVRFNEYEIVVDLSTDGKFKGIEEVRVKKDFRDYSEIRRRKAFEYIDSYQPE